MDDEELPQGEVLNHEVSSYGFGFLPGWPYEEDEEFLTALPEVEFPSDHKEFFYKIRQDSDWRTQKALLVKLYRQENEFVHKFVPTALELFKEENWHDRWAALQVFDILMGPPSKESAKRTGYKCRDHEFVEKHIPALLALLPVDRREPYYSPDNDNRFSVRAAVQEIFIKFKKKILARHVPEVLKQIEHPDVNVRRVGIRILEKVPGPDLEKHLPAMLKILHHDDEGVRKDAIDVMSILDVDMLQRGATAQAFVRAG
jgi:HEAT repeat protein